MAIWVILKPILIVLGPERVQKYFLHLENVPNRLRVPSLTLGYGMGTLGEVKLKIWLFWEGRGSKMVKNTKNTVFHPEHHIPWVYKVFKNHRKSKKTFKTHLKKRKNALTYDFEPFSHHNQFFEKSCFWKFCIFCLPCKSPSSECLLHKKMLIFRHFWNFQVLQCKKLVWTGPETSSDPFSNF